MKLKILLLFLIISMVILSGCTEKESETGVRKNCRELNGYLCSSEGECALDWLDSSDSYCCPIECKTCPEDVNCDDNNKCTKDLCVVKGGKPVCKHEQIKPCANNGICEMGETSIVHSPCCPGVACAETEVVALSDDCPKTCDDGNPDTADYYKIDTQSCEHENCIVDTSPIKLKEYSKSSDNIETTLGIYKANVYSLTEKDFLIKVTITNNNDVEIPYVSGPGVCILEGPAKGGMCTGGLSSETGFERFSWSHAPAKTTIEGWNIICGLNHLRTQGTKFAYCMSLNNSLVLFETDLSELNVN